MLIYELSIPYQFNCRKTVLYDTIIKQSALIM